MCRMRRFLAILRSFFHSSLLHIFLATLLHQLFIHLLSLHLAIYFLVYFLLLFIPNSNTVFGILFSSILCTCSSQRNLRSLIVSVVVGFLTIAYISLLVNLIQYSFSLFYILSFQKCSISFHLSLLVSKFMMHMLTFCLRVLLCF
jgi:hypothetical protein